jgi:hypothetical protein
MAKDAAKAEAARALTALDEWWQEATGIVEYEQAKMRPQLYPQLYQVATWADAHGGPDTTPLWRLHLACMARARVRLFSRRHATQGALEDAARLAMFTVERMRAALCRALAATSPERKVAPWTVALGILYSNPTISMTELAKQTPVSRATIYEESFKPVRDAIRFMKMSGRAELPTGHKRPATREEISQLEAWDEEKNEEK